MLHVSCCTFVVLLFQAVPRITTLFSSTESSRAEVLSNSNQAFVSGSAVVFHKTKVISCTRPLIRGRHVGVEKRGGESPPQEPPLLRSGGFAAGPC